MVMPRLMQRFSRRFQSRGSALRSTGCAPVIASMMPWLANHAIAHQTSVDDDDDRDDAGQHREGVAEAAVDGLRIERGDEHGDAEGDQAGAGTGSRPAAAADFSRLFQMWVLRP